MKRTVSTRSTVMAKNSAEKRTYHESKSKKGMGSYERDMYRPEHGYYEGMKARREQEMRDADMIQEDRSAIANLPQESMMKMYPQDRDYLKEGLDDTIRGVDGQIDMDNKGRDKNFMPKKW